jgi:hypothetical protein
MHGLQFSKFETKIKIYLRESNEIQLISHKKIDSLSNTHILYCKFIDCKFLDEFYDKMKYPRVKQCMDCNFLNLKPK